jgi:hypothetical protein
MAYGYVRDKEPLNINWAEISKNFNDRLAADEAERQGKREDIQKQYDELSQQLIDKPTGADIDLNSAISSFTTQASQASLDALNRLKRGEISEQEYYNRRANLKSSTSNLFLYANNFNSQLEENLKLIQSQDPDNQGSGRMAFQMALAQDMLNFKNTVAIIDPATDEVMLVKTDEEGNPTNEVVSVSQLGNLSSQKENSYNYKGRIARALENRGVAKYTTEDGKVITTIQGVDIKPGTATATIDKLAESFVGDESQILSILYQNGYQYTQDESLKGKDKYIYYDIKNGTYDYDKDKAVEFVKEDINNSIPVEVKDEISAYQQEQLKNERERIQIAKDNLALATQKANVDSDSLSYEAADNFMVDPDAPPGVTDDFIKPKDYIKKLNSNSFKSKTIEKTVDGLQSVLNHQGMKDAVVNTIIIEPSKKGGSPAGNLIRKLSYLPPGTGPARTKYTDATYGVEINIPGVLTEPIVLPLKYTPQLELNSLLETIDYAKENNLQVTPDNIAELLSAPNRKLFNDYRNVPVIEEEKVVVDKVTGGLDKIKNVVNQTQNNNTD